MIYTHDEVPNYDKYFYGFLAFFTTLGCFFAYVIT